MLKLLGVAYLEGRLKSRSYGILFFFYRECMPSSIKQVKAKFAAYFHSYLTGFSVESAPFLVVAISSRQFEISLTFM